MLNLDGTVVVLCGGVGGARCALAMLENLPAEQLTFIVNTGDDFQHLGLEIWPDWDTVLYHLADVQESSRGWGRADEGVRVMEELQRLGAPDWFHLGDRDLALHLYRTWRLRAGDDRAAVADAVARGFGIEAKLLPLTESSLDTKLKTAEGQVFDFQDWFVKERGEPEVAEVVTARAAEMRLTTGVLEAVEDASYILYAPSNPYLSLHTMLAVPAFAKAIQESNAPKLAVSPLVDGKAIKGPLDRLIQSLSQYQGQTAIAHLWAPWAQALMLPEDERHEIETPPLTLLGGPTMLKTKPDRLTFATSVLEHLRGLML